MEIVSLTLQGFKRFEIETTVNLAGNVIALIGPNEAGKSTILEALRDFASDEPLDIAKRSRGYQGRMLVSARYALDDADRQALSCVPGGTAIRFWTLEKWADDNDHGTIYRLDPWPNRSLTQRHTVLSELRKWAEHDTIKGLKSAGGVIVETLLAETIAALESEEEELTNSQLATIQRYPQIMRQFSQVKNTTAEGAGALEGYRQLLSRMESYDEGDSPALQAYRALTRRQPRVLEFSSSDRDLRSTYNLNEVHASPPQALRHLVQMASVDLVRLQGISQAQQRADQRTYLQNANRRLGTLFDQAWDQSPMSVELNVQAPILEVLVTTPEGDYSLVEERSDGLRAFVALRSFLACHQLTVPPILVVDEAETHLHYDAQANIVDLFTDQTLAAKVIYTTHSIGCLPRDLGTGIRVVEPLPGQERSRIKSSVWDDRSPGFNPLIVGLGAATFGFLPSRNVVFGEGVTEAMLLPTLMREATGVKNLDYQVAPGLAAIKPKRVGELTKEGGMVVFITDGDSEGRSYRKDLLKAGIPSDQMFGWDELLECDASIEDLIDPARYHEAIGAVLSENGAESKIPPLGDMPRFERVLFMKRWCSTSWIKRREELRITAKSCYWTVDTSMC